MITIYPLQPSPKNGTELSPIYIGANGVASIYTTEDLKTAKETKLHDALAAIAFLESINYSIEL